MTIGEFISLVLQKNVNLNKKLTVGSDNEFNIIEYNHELALTEKDQFYDIIQSFESDYKGK